MSADPERDVPEGAAVFPLIPEDLGVHPLILAALHAIVFLEGSDSNIVNENAAEEALQYIVGYMQRLKGPLLAEVRKDLSGLVSFARQENWPEYLIHGLLEFLTENKIGTEVED